MASTSDSNSIITLGKRKRNENKYMTAVKALKDAGARNVTVALIFSDDFRDDDDDSDTEEPSPKTQKTMGDSPFKCCYCRKGYSEADCFICTQCLAGGHDRRICNVCKIYHFGHSGKIVLCKNCADGNIPEKVAVGSIPLRNVPSSVTSKRPLVSSIFTAPPTASPLPSSSNLITPRNSIRPIHKPIEPLCRVPPTELVVEEEENEDSFSTLGDSEEEQDFIESEVPEIPEEDPISKGKGPACGEETDEEESEGEMSEEREDESEEEGEEEPQIVPLTEADSLTEPSDKGSKRRGKKIVIADKVFDVQPKESVLRDEWVMIVWRMTGIDLDARPVNIPPVGNGPAVRLMAVIRNSKGCYTDNFGRKFVFRLHHISVTHVFDKHKCSGIWPIDLIECLRPYVRLVSSRYLVYPPEAFTPHNNLKREMIKYINNLPQDYDATKAPSKRTRQQLLSFVEKMFDSNHCHSTTKNFYRVLEYFRVWAPMVEYPMLNITILNTLWLLATTPDIPYIALSWATISKAIDALNDIKDSNVPGLFPIPIANSYYYSDSEAKKQAHHRVCNNIKANTTVKRIRIIGLKAHVSMSEWHIQIMKYHPECAAVLDSYYEMSDKLYRCIMDVYKEYAPLEVTRDPIVPTQASVDILKEALRIEQAEEN